MSENGSNLNIEATASESTTLYYSCFEDGASSTTVAENNIQSISEKLEDQQEFHSLDNIRGGASSKDAVNIIGESNFGEVTSTPSKGTTRRGKSKARPKSVKSGVKANKRPKQGQASPFYKPTKPRHFIGYIICKEYNGVRFLGTVASYSPKKKLLKIEYEDGRAEYLKQNEVVKYTATDEDIEEGKKRCPSRQKKRGKIRKGSIV